MIERHWKGIAKKKSAEAYITHLRNDTFKQLASISGFIAARILKRNTGEGIEFLIVTEWQNIESIKRFAGSDIDKAVVPESVQSMMLSYDKYVNHYSVDFNIIID